MPRVPQATIQAPKIRPLTTRLAVLSTLLGMVHPVPTKWLTSVSGGLDNIAINTKEEPHDGIAIKTCDNYSDLIKAWRKAMKWSEGLDSAMAVMLASSMSTEFVGEQLWFKIIGPPSCGKTSLMEGLATARKWYLSKDTIRGFHSGWKREDNKDVSLAEKVRGKTLATKDGDTLLKAPNLKQILAEGRALYDRVSRTDYRNDVAREYVNHRMTWHLAGTNSLREIDDSELGARFLDVVVMDTIDDEFENEVGLLAASQEIRNMQMIGNGKGETHYPSELAEAMALSGGYLDHLRTNALEISKSVQVDNRYLSLCNKFGKFIALMRARSNGQSDPEREFSPRLVKQLSRLLFSLTAILGKKETDDEVAQRVHKVVMDTSRGSTLELVKCIYDRPQGIEVRGLAALLHKGDNMLRRQLKFLRKIGVMETDSRRKRWRVTPRVVKLYQYVEGVG